jgi:DNA-binding MurR/RpiR family transcriptional regulator
MSQPTLQARLYDHAGDLTGGQRKVADLLARDPEAVAFGTTASIAELAGTSGPTVVRFAMRLGYSGFAELQEELRAEIAQRARTAVGRMQHRPAQAADVASAREVDQRNLLATLDRLDRRTFNRLVDLLSDDRRSVWVLPSAQTVGIAMVFTESLQVVRDGVHLVHGNELYAVSRLAAVRKRDIVVTMDVQRHEQMVLKLQRLAVRRGAVPVVMTDRSPSAYETAGGSLVTFACEAVGPFESLVGLLSLGNALIAAVADRHRAEVTRRLRLLEAAWSGAGVFH